MLAWSDPGAHWLPRNYRPRHLPLVYGTLQEAHSGPWSLSPSRHWCSEYSPTEAPSILPGGIDVSRRLFVVRELVHGLDPRQEVLGRDVIHHRVARGGDVAASKFGTRSGTPPSSTVRKRVLSGSLYPIWLRRHRRARHPSAEDGRMRVRSGSSAPSIAAGRACTNLCLDRPRRQARDVVGHRELKHDDQGKRGYHKPGEHRAPLV